MSYYILDSLIILVIKITLQYKYKNIYQNSPKKYPDKFR